jgi:hypothetical protein
MNKEEFLDVVQEIANDSSIAEYRNDQDLSGIRAHDPQLGALLDGVLNAFQACVDYCKTRTEQGKI